MHNRKAVTKVLYHAFVVLFGFMMVYPVLWMISGSFKGNAEILRGTLSLIPKELKLTNYATGWKGFGGTTFATFFTNSIFITVIATFGTVISSSLVAYALSRVRFRGRKPAPCWANAARYTAAPASAAPKAPASITLAAGTIWLWPKVVLGTPIVSRLRGRTTCSAPMRQCRTTRC